MAYFCREPAKLLHQRVHSLQQQAGLEAPSGGFRQRIRTMDPGPPPQDTSSKGGTEETRALRKVEPEIDAAVQAVSVLVNERLSLQASATQVQPSILALESLQDCINELQRGITAKIVELKRYKNQNEVLLHTLPPEIFLEILSASIDWPNWNVERNHTLGQVCKHWWRTITTVSWFWPEIDVAHGKETTAMILRKNQAGPLVVRCAADGGGHSERVEFMKLAVQHATRWKSLIFKGRLTDELFALLETPAPLLSELFIYPYNGPDQRQFHLSEGAFMKHLDCDFCSLPWDSSRLSKLQSIQIRNLTRDLPSIPQLRNILEASPQLHWLLLASWSDDSQGTTPAADADTSKGKQVAESSPPSPIHLPSLETLVLQNVPRDINDYLLTHIYAPSCTCLIAGIRPASLRSLPPRLSPNQTHPSNTFADLLSPAITAAPEIMMSYEESKGTFRIYSSPEPEVSNEWIHWVKRKPGINFLFHTDKTAEVGADLRHALSGLNLEKATTLNLIGDGTNPNGEATTDTASNGETSSSFPVEALQALPQVTQLFSARNFRVGDVVKYLSQPLAEVSGRTDGEETWPLPQLSTLSLSRWRPASDAKGMLDEILQFGLLRKGDMERNEDDWVGSWPKPLERLVVPPEVAEAFKEANSTFDGVEVQNLR
ncbi:hypothetical protein FS837_009244 [Tulasnella sp. UAMH 9824]|nr:hypothetical protein FS837_009244 [Tulasnella sp. UAMH 9824]